LDLSNFTNESNISGSPNNTIIAYDSVNNRFYASSSNLSNITPHPTEPE
jgi:hypothetical protein